MLITPPLHQSPFMQKTAAWRFFFNEELPQQQGVFHAAVFNTTSPPNRSMIAELAL
jgi:hypothetical protein